MEAPISLLACLRSHSKYLAEIGTSSEPCNPSPWSPLELPGRIILLSLSPLLQAVLIGVLLVLCSLLCCPCCCPCCPPSSLIDLPICSPSCQEELMFSPDLIQKNFCLCEDQLVMGGFQDCKKFWTEHTVPPLETSSFRNQGHGSFVHPSSRC